MTFGPYAVLIPGGGTLWLGSALPTLSTDGQFTVNDLFMIVGGSQAGQLSVCTASTSGSTAATWLPVKTPSNLLSTKMYFAGDQQILSSTQGVDTAGVATQVFIGAIYIPIAVTLTGVQFLIGSVGGTDKVVVALYNSAGKVVANSALDSSVTVGTAATVQQVPFTATYAAVPGLYFIGVSTNGTTAKIRTQFSGSEATAIATAQTFNTLTSVTPPTTFTTAQAPVGGSY